MSANLEAETLAEDYFLVLDERRRVPMRLGIGLLGGGEADIRPVPDYQGCVAKMLMSSTSPCRSAGLAAVALATITSSQAGRSGR